MRILQEETTPQPNTDPKGWPLGAVTESWFEQCLNLLRERIRLDENYKSVTRFLPASNQYGASDAADAAAAGVGRLGTEIGGTSSGSGSSINRQLSPPPTSMLPNTNPQRVSGVVRSQPNSAWAKEALEVKSPVSNFIAGCHLSAQKVGNIHAIVSSSTLISRSAKNLVTARSPALHDLRQELKFKGFTIEEKLIRCCVKRSRHVPSRQLFHRRTSRLHYLD